MLYICLSDPKFASSRHCMPVVQVPVLPEAASQAAQQQQVGIQLVPDFTQIGKTLSNLPDDKMTHPLDVVPKSDTDSGALTVRHLLHMLQQTGFVQCPGAISSARGIAAHAAVAAVHHACFPDSELSAEVRHHLSI